MAVIEVEVDRWFTAGDVVVVWICWGAFSRRHLLARGRWDRGGEVWPTRRDLRAR